MIFRKPYFILKKYDIKNVNLSKIAFVYSYIHLINLLFGFKEIKNDYQKKDRFFYNLCIF